jgi:hypothetical protein
MPLVQLSASEFRFRVKRPWRLVPVFLEGQWLDVPDDAVLTQPNLHGRTVVWPIKMFAGMTIQCFIPASMM